MNVTGGGVNSLRRDRVPPYFKGLSKDTIQKAIDYYNRSVQKNRAVPPAAPLQILKTPPIKKSHSHSEIYHPHDQQTQEILGIIRKEPPMSQQIILRNVLYLYHSDNRRVNNQTLQKQRINEPDDNIKRNDQFKRSTKSTEHESQSYPLTEDYRLPKVQDASQLYLSGEIFNKIKKLNRQDADRIITNILSCIQSQIRGLHKSQSGPF